MKNTLTTLCIATMLCACSKSENPTTPAPEEWETIEVQYEVKNAWEVTSTYEDMSTRAADLTEAACGYLYCFVDGELECSQASTDPNFGKPTLSLTYGAHQIRFVASTDPMEWADGNGTPMSVGGAAPRVRDTFGKSVTLSVDASTPSQSVTLDRAISQVKMYVDDALPSNIGTIEMTIDKHYLSLSQNTLCGTTPASFTNSWAVSQYAGVSGANFTVSTYVPSFTDPWPINVTIRFKSTNGTLLQERTTAINLLCNRRTILHGTYRKSGANTIQVNNEWGTDSTEKW